MNDLARAVITEALFGPDDRRKRWPWILGGLAAGFALFRWRAAHDMHVPLDLAFKHPFTPIKTLYTQEYERTHPTPAAPSK